MIPTNRKTQKPATMTSSDTVLWDGPNIPCIDLCRGDHITKVVFELATKLCKIAEDVNPANYDLECVDLNQCDTPTFQQIIQMLITEVFCTEDGEGSGGEPGEGGETNCCARTVRYAQNQVWTDITKDPNLLTFTEYTVPTGGTGLYEVMFNTNFIFGTTGTGLAIGITVNGVLYQPNFIRSEFGSNSTTTQLEPFLTNGDTALPFLSVPTTLFASEIALTEGDIISVYVENTSDLNNLPGHSLERSVFKLTKLS